MDKGNERRDGLRGVRPPCPVVPASDGSCILPPISRVLTALFSSPHGGVRISMRGLARIGKMILHNGDGFLSPASIATLIGPEWRFNGKNGENRKGFNCTFGLSIQTLATAEPGCRDDPFGDGLPRVGHAGEAYGLRSGLWIDCVNGTGIAFFTTAVADDAPLREVSLYCCRGSHTAGPRNFQAKQGRHRPRLSAAPTIRFGPRAREDK